jgi:hypothetical protein
MNEKWINKKVGVKTQSVTIKEMLKRIYYPFEVASALALLAAITKKVTLAASQALNGLVTFK